MRKSKKVILSSLLIIAAFLSVSCGDNTVYNNRIEDLEKENMELNKELELARQKIAEQEKQIQMMGKARNDISQYESIYDEELRCNSPEDLQYDPQERWMPY